MKDECDNCETSIWTSIIVIAVLYTSCEICTAQRRLSEKPGHIAVGTMTPSKYTLTSFYRNETCHRSAYNLHERFLCDTHIWFMFL